MRARPGPGGVPCRQEESSMTDSQRLRYSLFLLRLGVFVVMLMWTLDKIVNPGHAAAVFAGFYGIAGAEAFILIVAIAELVLIAAFMGGLYKRVSYGLVMILHGVSTFSAFGRYLQPWDNLLFFAAWPMLAACVALYLLRDRDTLLTVRGG
jgi:membrane-associated protease RseP (regulator of RpoE activity)